MASLVKCRDCGHKVSKRADKCPQCGAPVKRKSSGCLSGIALLFVIAIVIGVISSSLDGTKPKSAPAPAAASALETPLPTHKFNPSSRPGQAKSQIRAVIQPGTMTEQQIRDLAVRLCQKYESRAWESFLVQFFASDAAIQNWDGTGALRETDWPVFLCHVTIETNTGGKLHANFFSLARDVNSGQERTDVLKH